MEPIIEVIVVRDIVFQSKLISFAKYLFVCLFLLFLCLSLVLSLYFSVAWSFSFLWNWDERKNNYDCISEIQFWASRSQSVSCSFSANHWTILFLLWHLLTKEFLFICFPVFMWKEYNLCRVLGICLSSFRIFQHEMAHFSSQSKEWHSEVIWPIVYLLPKLTYLVDVQQAAL